MSKHIQTNRKRKATNHIHKMAFLDESSSETDELCRECNTYVDWKTTDECTTCLWHFHDECGDLQSNLFRNEDMCGDEMICKRCFDEIQPLCVCTEGWESRDWWFCRSCYTRFHEGCGKPTKIFFDEAKTISSWICSGCFWIKPPTFCIHFGTFRGSSSRVRGYEVFIDPGMGAFLFILVF